MILDTAVCADGRRVAYETLEEAVRARHGPNTFVVVALHEPDRKELGFIADELGLSKQIMGDAINPPHRAGIQQYEDLLSIWLASVRYPGGERCRMASRARAVYPRI
jgi:Mg2+ and Co2+ transporter CorA